MKIDKFAITSYTKKDGLECIADYDLIDQLPKKIKNNESYEAWQWSKLRKGYITVVATQDREELEFIVQYLTKKKNKEGKI